MEEVYHHWSGTVLCNAERSVSLYTTEGIPILVECRHLLAFHESDTVND